MAKPSLPPELLCDDAEQAASKLERFRQAGTNHLQLVFDFDRTLTVSRPGAQGDITTWHIMKEHLPAAGQARYQALFERYRGLELAGTMTNADAVRWWSSILELFVEHRINLQEVERDFLAKASIRPFAKELFEYCARHVIPTVILSAGIKDVIEIWARTYGIQPTIIIATALKLDDRGVVRGWDEASLVHVLNKKEAGHPELAAIRKRHSHTILIGDSINDADMAEGDDAVFRFLLHDPRPDEDAAALRRRALTVFDAVIETGSLQPVHQLITS